MARAHIKKLVAAAAMAIAAGGVGVDVAVPGRPEPVAGPPGPECEHRDLSHGRVGGRGRHNVGPDPGRTLERQHLGRGRDPQPHRHPLSHQSTFTRWVPFREGATAATPISRSPSISTARRGASSRPAAPCGARPVGVSASSASDVWVVGGKESVQGDYGFAQHFNGHVWTVVPFPATANASAVVDLSATDAWAAGGYGAIIHWSGSSWTTTVPGSNKVGLNAITALSPTDLWAVGFDYGTTFPNDRTFAEHFNGTTWSAVPTPSPGAAIGGSDDLNGVSSAAGGHVFAVGTTFPDNFTSKTLILENDQG